MTPYHHREATALVAAESQAGATHISIILDHERALLSLSDDEILMWFVAFDECPHPRHSNRLRQLRRTRREFRPGGAWGPPRAPFTGREEAIAAKHRRTEAA